MSIPQSIIKICSGVRLNNNYEHTIYFSDLSKQLSYFEGKVVKTFPSYSYLRKSWDIKVNATMSQAKNWSYLFFNNGDKNYFYFINNIEYVNDTTVKLFLEIDVMQTYMFDYELLRCFVEREHISDDTIGKHTVEENLEIGELITHSQNNVDLGEYCVLILASYDPMTTTNDFTDTTLFHTINGVFSALSIYASDISDGGMGLGAKLKQLNDDGKIDGVISMWMYPKKLLSFYNDYDSDAVCNQVKSIKTFNVDYARPLTLNGYTPKNNKMFCYPYNFMYVSNNNGNSANYKYERFDNADTCTFQITGAVTPEGSVKMYPLHYNNTAFNFEEGIDLSNFPTCAWNSDIYKLWLAQNQNQQNLSFATNGISFIGGVGTAIGGALTGNIPALVGGVGASLHSASSIGNILAKREDMKVQPPQSKGNHSSNVNIVNGFQTFTIQKKCVDNVHAKIIDDYFSMYGYKRNVVKIPNRNVRENWTYTKTVGCHIKGNLCTEDILKIESIYNNGVTFWVDGDSIGNYSLSNST